MGCASSAALPFLTNRGHQAVSGSPRLNGEPPYELNMVNNKLRENGAPNLKDVNEAYASEKLKEAADAAAVQGVLGGIAQTTDDIVGQVKGVGEAVSEKVASAVEGAEEAVGSAFGKVSSAVESLEERVKSEAAEVEEKVRAALGAGEEKTSEVRAEDLDELLDSLPTEEEVTEAAKSAAEGVLERAVEEVKGEEEDGE